jgi:uncharacterized protein YoxC
MDPLFWLGVSLCLVAMSLTAVLIVAIPAFQELSKAAQSAQKLFDLLAREMPPTLESMRRTGNELSELSDDMSQGLEHANHVVKQVDESLSEVKYQVDRAKVGTTSLVVGLQAAWRSLASGGRSKRSQRRRRG